MDAFKDYELSQIVGGGYWWQDSTGVWHYIPDDEDPDYDDIIWV